MTSGEKPPTHETDVRRRRRGWIASCSCGWSQEAVSGYAGWSATRSHVYDAQVAAGMTRPMPAGRPRVRLLRDDPG